MVAGGAGNVWPTQVTNALSWAAVSWVAHHCFISAVALAACGSTSGSTVAAAAVSGNSLGGGEAAIRSLAEVFVKCP